MKAELFNSVFNANPAKRLCEYGVCKSMAEARRIVSLVDNKRIDQMIERRSKVRKIK